MQGGEDEATASDTPPRETKRLCLTMPTLPSTPPRLSPIVPPATPTPTPTPGGVFPQLEEFALHVVKLDAQRGRMTLYQRVTCILHALQIVDVALPDDPTAWTSDSFASERARLKTLDEHTKINGCVGVRRVLVGPGAVIVLYASKPLLTEFSFLILVLQSIFGAAMKMPRAHVVHESRGNGVPFLVIADGGVSRQIIPEAIFTQTLQL